MNPREQLHIWKILTWLDMFGARTQVIVKKYFKKFIFFFLIKNVCFLSWMTKIILSIGENVWQEARTNDPNSGNLVLVVLVIISSICFITMSKVAGPSIKHIYTFSIYLLKLCLLSIDWVGVTGSTVFCFGYF